MNKKILAIVGIVVIVIIAGAIYILRSNNADKLIDTGKTVEDATIGKTAEDAAIIKNDFDAVITKSFNIDLKDVSKTGGFGTAWLGLYNGKTHHRLIAKNLPVLPGTDFYEGWLVKNPLTRDYFSTGKMKYDPLTKEARLDFIVDGDKSEYLSVVITSERDDGNPKPGKHVLEGRFPTNTNFQITFDEPIEKSGTK